MGRMNKEKIVLALGMFDGVHAGHKKLIETAKEQAYAYNAMCCVYTYLNHPATLLNRKVKMLTSAEQRKELLIHSGADRVIMDEFTQKIRNTPANEFLDFLKTKFDPCCIVAGFNYTYGMNCKGTPDTLTEFCSENGIQTVILDPVQIDGETVSSTSIRSHIENGRIDRAESLLMRPYSVSGSFQDNENIYRICTEYVLPISGLYSGFFMDENGGEHTATLRIHEGYIAEPYVLTGASFRNAEDIRFTFCNRIDTGTYRDYDKNCECIQGK